MQQHYAFVNNLDIFSDYIVCIPSHILNQILPSSSFVWLHLAFALALNADNLAANRVIYVAATGAVDILAYILSIILLNFFGRKLSSCGLFGLSGFFLLSLIFVPRGEFALLPMWHNILGHNRHLTLTILSNLQRARIGSYFWRWLVVLASVLCIRLLHCIQLKCSQLKFEIRRSAHAQPCRMSDRSRHRTLLTFW